MEKHTTTISKEPGRPLDVEWLDLAESPGGGRHKVLPGGGSQLLPSQFVSLVLPSTPWQGHVRLVNLSPRTALNLLAWLEAERPELEQRAREWEEAERDYPV